MESGVQKIKLLNGNNWHSWRIDIKVLMMDRACYGFIDGTEPEFKEEGATRKDTLDYRSRRDRAYSTIYYSIEECYRNLIADTTDGKAAYKKLEEYFQPSTRARVISLLDEFFNLRYDGGSETIGLYCARLRQCVQRLADSGHPLPELYQGFQLIRYLPPEFNGIVQLIYRWPESDFTFDKISKELLLEEDRLSQLHRDLTRLDISSSSAYSTQVKSKSAFPRYRKNASQGKQSQISNNSNNSQANRSSQQQKPVSCGNCGKKGHVIANCWSRQKTPSPGNMKKTDSRSRFSAANVEILVNQVQTKVDKTSWCLDTGATHHFTNNRDLLFDYVELSDTSMALAVGGAECPVEGVGTIKFSNHLNGGKHDMEFTNVMYSPKLRRNLLSLSKLEQCGARFSGAKGFMSVYNAENVHIIKAKRTDNLYIIKPKHELPTVNLVKVTKKSPAGKAKKSKSKTKSKKNSSKVQDLVKPKCSNVAKHDGQKSSAPAKTGDVKKWHARYSHTNQDYIVNTSKNDSVRGLPILKPVTLDCRPCKLAKSKRKSFKPIGTIRSKAPLQLVHMDLCGKMPVPSVGGSEYFLTITDDYSRKVVVFPLAKKSDVFLTFTRFQRRAERFLNCKIVSVRTDNGLEFCHQAFEEFLSKQGIRMERTNVYTPEQNGVSERFNLTALDGIKAMLNDSGLDDQFWAEALLNFVYTWNRVCHKGQAKTPFELYGGWKPSVSHLKVFGCLAYVGIPKQKRRKLDMRAELGIMVGYAMRTRGYRVWIFERNIIIETSNVRFNESIQGVEGVLGPKDSGKPKVGEKQSPKYAEFHPVDYQDDSDEGGDVVEREDGGVPAEAPATLTPCEDIPWERYIVKRPDGTRTDVYYRIQGKTSRLRSPGDVEKHCKSNDIQFNRTLFDFSGSNEYEGLVSNAGSGSS